VSPEDLADGASADPMSEPTQLTLDTDNRYLGYAVCSPELKARTATEQVRCEGRKLKEAAQSGLWQFAAPSILKSPEGVMLMAVTTMAAPSMRSLPLHDTFTR
jgi:hypothetical protein